MHQIDGLEQSSSRLSWGEGDQGEDGNMGIYGYGLWAMGWIFMGEIHGMGIFHIGQDKGMHRVHTHYGMYSIVGYSR